MFIVIDLRDHKNKSYDTVKFDFTAQATIKLLQDKILSRFQIGIEYQQIFDSKNSRIDLLNGSLEGVGLKDNETLILKHGLLDNFFAFQKNLESAQKALSSKEDIDSDVESAAMQLKPLIESRFFVVYPQFDHLRREFKSEFSFYLDSAFKHIETASIHYFSMFYQENPACPVLDIRCVKKRRCGVQGGLECQIYREGKLFQLFHVKIHTRLAKWHDNKSCDLRELLVYKLLEKINVGAIVHFFPNMHFSGFGLYIASQDIQGFRREADIEEENTTRTAQLELLCCCLYLKDLKSNDENYGADEHEQLKIVDFEIGDHNANTEDVARQYLSRNTRQRLAIGKNSFSCWDLLKNIDAANVAIADQKKLLEQHEIFFKTDRILDDYVTNVRHNVITMTNHFDSTSV